mmetsp:Transcript_13677/g.42312  ORF Transcript_13677/g.42312 Transcript_13677/m.42312 type:complete len:254 (+) Transcript_13677:298-1059(+)
MPKVFACRSRASSEHSLPSNSASKTGGRCQPSEHSLGPREQLRWRLEEEQPTSCACICCSRSTRSRPSPPSSSSSGSCSCVPGGAPAAPSLHWPPCEIRTETISAKAACSKSPSCSGTGPNFHMSPWTCSKSASAELHESSPWKPASGWAPASPAEQRITARTGRSLDLVCERLLAIAAASSCSCCCRLFGWPPDGLSTRSTKTMAVLNASRRLMHLGMSWPKLTGAKPSLASFCRSLPGLPASGPVTAQRQR